MDSMQKQAVLAACQLFSMLDASSLARLAAVARVVRAAASYTLLRQGQPSRGLYVVARGAVKLCLCSPAGKEFCIAVAGRGILLNSIGPLSGKALTHAITIEPSVVLVVPLEALEHVMSTELCQAAMLQQLNEQLMLLLNLLEDVTLHALDVRVARLLHRLHLHSQRNAAARLHRLNQSTLSSMANGSRSKVNEHLQALRRLGAIDIQDGAVVMRCLDLLATVL